MRAGGSIFERPDPGDPVIPSPLHESPVSPLAAPAVSAVRPRGLLRVLGAAFGLAMVVGATVGAGILRTPGEIAAALPTPALFLSAWVFGAAIPLLGANIFAELGAMTPRSGGVYVFARRAFGDGTAFFTGYASWLNWCLGPVALTIVVGEYAGGLFPPLAGHEMAVAFAVLGVLVGLQWIGVRVGGRTQELMTVLKALALLALVVAAFLMPHPVVEAASVSAPHGAGLLLAFGVATQGVLFTYDGYYAVVFCGEEIRDPGREIPRAMFRGIWLIIALYLLINLAYVAVLPVSSMAGDPFVGATMARALFGPRGDPIIRLIMIISILGTVNAELIAIPRILLAMSQDGLFPRQAARVNAGGTPSVALGLSLVVIVASMLSGSFRAVLALDASIVVVLYLVSFAAFFVLRRREPDAPRPYRARGYPVLPGMALALMAGLGVVFSLADPRSAVILLGVLLASWPLSRLVRRAVRAGARATAQ